MIQLAPAAVALLRELATAAKPGVPWVRTGERGGPVNNLRRAWLALRVRAELDDVRLHDLRHSAASDAIAAGVPLALVGTMLGHKHPQTTQRYKHLGDATLQEAAWMMGEAIERSTREGAERLRQRQRAVGDHRLAPTTTDGGGVVAIDARKVVGFRYKLAVARVAGPRAHWYALWLRRTQGAPRTPRAAAPRRTQSQRWPRCGCNRRG